MKGISKSEEEEEANIVSNDLSKFLDDMKPHTKLSWQSPKDSLHLWVFWSQEEECHHHASTNSDTGNLANHWSTIQRHIKTALSSFNTCGFENLLVQFWAPTPMIGGRHHLTTSHQPFALKNMNVALTQYRKHCLSYNFVVPDVDAEGEEDHTLVDGLPTRVFRNQLPEFSPDLSYYSVKEYPQRDFALICGIPQTLAFPVFEASQQRCVGVLEILLIGDFSPIFDYYVDMTKSALKKAGLITINTWQMCYQIRKGIRHAAEEFKEALQQVCATHSLPLACVWSRCKHSSSDSRYTDCDINCSGQLVVSIPGMGIYDDKRSYEYCGAALSLPLRLGQGLVGKAFLSDKPYFCRDVTQLSISENPLAHLACKLGFAGCLAIRVQSSATRDHAYVIEFFLRDKAYGGDPHNLLSSILAILSQHFKSFEVAAGDMGNDLFTEVYKLGESFAEASMGKGENVICAEESNTAFTSYKTISTLETSERGCTETGDALSIDITESTLRSTGRKPNIYAAPTCKRSKPESSFSDDRSAPSKDFDGGFKDHQDSDLDLKKRKVLPTWTGHQGVRSENETKVTNGWKMNGDEVILGAMFPRNYYRCTDNSTQCDLATKTVKRDYDYPLLFDMTYGGRDTSYLSRAISVPILLSPGKHGKDQNHHRTNHQQKELDEILSNLQENHSVVETEVLGKSSTASSDFLTLFGKMMSVEESQNPIPNECRGDSSFSKAPLSEVSAVVAPEIPPCTPVVDEEMVTIKVKYGEDFIIFSLPPSSGLDDLVDNVSMRLTMLMEKTFYFKYLDNSGEWNSLATDDDLQECLAKSRSGDKKMISMLIQLKPEGECATPVMSL